MARYTVALLILLTAGLAAQLPPVQPNTVLRFPASELDPATKALMERVKTTGREYKPIFDVPTHRMLFVTVSDAKTPPAEQHRYETDIWIITSGTGSIQIGGEIVNQKENAAFQEVLGTAIKGGEKFPVAAGDVINIPANVAHQALVGPGESYGYYVIKVKEEPKKP